MTHQDILRDFPLAVSLIEAEEGFRPTPYKCTAGKTTIGFGTNADAHGLDVAGAVWTRAQAEAVLLDDLEVSVAELDRRWPGWRNLDDIRKAVILSAVYQLGVYGAAQFKATITALIGRDFTAASERLLASRWAKQTPARVKRNAEAIRTGKLPEVVNGVEIFPAGTLEDGDATPAEPAARILPAERLRHDNPQSALVLPPISSPVSTVSWMNPTVKMLCTSKTMGGAVSLLAIVAGNISFRGDITAFGAVYHVNDVTLLAAVTAFLVVVWGRITAKPIKGAS